MTFCFCAPQLEMWTSLCPSSLGKIWLPAQKWWLPPSISCVEEANKPDPARGRRGPRCKHRGLRLTPRCERQDAPRASPLSSTPPLPPERCPLRIPEPVFKEGWGAEKVKKEVRCGAQSERRLTFLQSRPVHSRQTSRSSLGAWPAWPQQRCMARSHGGAVPCRNRAPRPAARRACLAQGPGPASHLWTHKPQTCVGRVQWWSGGSSGGTAELEWVRVGLEGNGDDKNGNVGHHCDG